MKIVYIYKPLNVSVIANISVGVIANRPWLESMQGYQERFSERLVWAY